jgi:hypothetical protein
MRGILRARPTSAVRPAALIASALLLALAAPAARAWSPPSAIYVNGDSKAYAVAGDPGGNAFAVVGGGTLDEPLALVERDLLPGVSLSWGAPAPLPALPAHWTVSGRTVGAASAAAAGQGAGLIAIRWDQGAASLLTALVRDDAGLDFAPPVALVGGRFSPMSDPAVGISDGGEAIVAVGATTPGTTRRRVAIVTRMPGVGFAVPRFFRSATLSRPSVGIGADGSPVVAWVTGHRAVASSIADNGVPQRPQLLGDARPHAPIAAAVGHMGNGVVAWEDGSGRLRLVRRSAPGRLSLSLPISAANKDRIGDISAAVDEFGRAFVTWRVGTGAATRIIVAQAGVGATFRLSTLAQGAGLGAPAITTRPGGGAAVIWSAPRGWQAAKAPKNGVFGTTSTVSAPLQSGDAALATGAAIAGPGPSVDIIWRQYGVEAPADGIQVLQSQDDQP